MAEEAAGKTGHGDRLNAATVFRSAGPFVE